MDILWTVLISSVGVIVLCMVILFICDEIDRGGKILIDVLISIAICSIVALCISLAGLVVLEVWSNIEKQELPEKEQSEIHCTCCISNDE